MKLWQIIVLAWLWIGFVGAVALLIFNKVNYAIEEKLGEKLGEPKPSIATLKALLWLLLGLFTWYLVYLQFSLWRYLRLREVPTD